MAIELTIPQIGESITEVQIGEWLKQPGDAVAVDEPIVVIETDKATVELPAPAAGVLTSIAIPTGEMTEVGAVVGIMEAGAEASATAPPEPAASSPEPASPSVPTASPTLTTPAEQKIMPAAAHELATKGIAAADVTASGPGGRLLKEDVQAQATKSPATTLPTSGSLTQQFRRATSGASTAAPAKPSFPVGAREEEIVPMTPMRRRIAERLLAAQQNMALLTTFNEIDMTAVMNLRKQHRDAFMKKYDIKLGFMSFFVKAVIDALKQFPQVNAEIRDQEIVYKHYFDIGIAVGSGKGLVVPVLRDAQAMSFSDIELAISDFGARAKINRITLDELKGGTFTISNGGVYGSLLSTPIVNPPQSGILGLHSIQDRAVVVDGAVVVRPMMYIALTYDHRLVDGREGVAFLKRIKEAIEDPARMLLEV